MKSLSFKILNSLWVILAFVPYISGIAFIYAGIRVKKKLWIYVGIIYTALWILSFTLVSTGNSLAYIPAATITILWLIGMIYVFFVLREFLIRLEAIEGNQDINVIDTKPNMKSLPWKILNSLWIIFAFIPFFNGGAFLYAGIRVKKKLWIYIGVIFSLSSGMWVAFMSIDPSIGQLFGGISVILWMAGMVYVFFVLREFLIRLEAIGKSQYSNNNLREKIFAEYNVNGNVNSTFNDTAKENAEYDVKNIIDEAISDNEQEKNLDLDLVDINKDSENKLSELPGINSILAKRIAELRSSGYEFNSVEDLAQKLDLKPHVMENLRSLVKFSPIKRKEHRGRKVDV